MTVLNVSIEVDAVGARRLVPFVFALLVCACGGADKDPLLVDGPEVGSPCGTLGALSCGQDSYDHSVVLRCSGADGDVTIWKVDKQCPHGCSDSQCVEGGEDVVVDPPDSDIAPVDAGADAPEDDAAEVGEVQDAAPEDEGCVPDCENKECGLDGCGGYCGECPEGDSCLGGAGICCTPDCFGKLCGDDKCGGVCGTCPEGQECNTYDQCGPVCEPKCDDKECGPDGCNGGSCGDCPEGKACGPEGLCSICVPQCEGKECGDDGCGGECGGCQFGFECENFECSVICVPTCPGTECGTDGCGGSCGVCMPGETCVGGQCEIQCDPSCVGKECGPDGCGGECGKCAPWAWCSPQGSCITDCVPDCAGKVCGSDACGGSCGQCADGELCVPDGSCHGTGDPCGAVDQSGWCDGANLILCIEGSLEFIDCLTEGKNVICEWMPALDSHGCNPQGECVPLCTGKECGDDGCGGSCGSCGFGQECENGYCVGQGECGDISYNGCCQSDAVFWCDNGYLWHMDCTAMDDPAHQKCGWNADFQFYDCIAEQLEGPVNFPYYCQGVCIPDCVGKQCGDDGCGGNCGDCPPGVECEDNQCKGEGGDCGGYSEDPVCQGETMVWCEEGQVLFQDCASYGAYWHCGWVPDLFVYSCFQEECIPDCEDKVCGDDGCGYVCGYCAVTQHCNDKNQCVYGQGLCPEGLDYVGVCEANVVNWCQNGIMQTFDCANLGPNWQCGWYQEGGYYWCVEQ